MKKIRFKSQDLNFAIQLVICLLVELYYVYSYVTLFPLSLLISIVQRQQCLWCCTAEAHPPLYFTIDMNNAAKSKLDGSFIK